MLYLLLSFLFGFHDFHLELQLDSSGKFTCIRTVLDANNSSLQYKLATSVAAEYRADDGHFTTANHMIDDVGEALDELFFELISFLARIHFCLEFLL